MVRPKSGRNCGVSTNPAVQVRPSSGFSAGLEPEMPRMVPPGTDWKSAGTPNAAQLAARTLGSLPFLIWIAEHGSVIVKKFSDWPPNSSPIFGARSADDMVPRRRTLLSIAQSRPQRQVLVWPLVL